MGNEPGPLERGKKANVLIVMQGEVSAEVADNFRDELDALLDRYRPQMGDLTRPIKRASSRRARARTATKAKGRSRKKKSRSKR